MRTPLYGMVTILLLNTACAQPPRPVHAADNPQSAHLGASTNPQPPSDAAESESAAQPNRTGVSAKPAEKATPSSDDRISFTLGLNAGDMLYYVVESEYRESGGVPPLLSYSTAIKDRKTISQRVMPRSLRQATNPEAEDDPLFTILWKFERYEVTEQGMKDTLTYDSVRHVYPPPTLWELGGITGAKVTFFLDPVTSRNEGMNITPSKPAGESTRRPMSKLASKCQLTNENLASLLHDLGPYWMPESPVEVGETWTRTYSDDLRNFGKTSTTLNCTLQSVRKIGDRRIARVEIMGDVLLEPAPQPTTRPGQPARANPQREFRIERSTCKGTVEFDLARGELYTLNLHRELHLTASVESERSGTMELKTGWTHILKVKTGQTPPPKPIIVGGPKLPEVPAEEKRSPTPPRRTPTVPSTATQPAQSPPAKTPNP